MVDECLSLLFHETHVQTTVCKITTIKLSFKSRGCVWLKNHMLEIKSIAILANLYWVNQYNYRPQPHAWSPIGDWCHRQSLNQLFPLQPANYISDKWATMVSEKNPLIYTNEITKACRFHPQILPCLMLNNPAWNTLVSRRLPLPMGLNFSFNNRIRLAPPDDSRILTVNDVARGCCTTNAWQIYTYLNNDPIIGSVQMTALNLHSV